MFGKFLNHFFGNNESQAKKRTTPLKGRKLQFEPLEERELLSASPSSAACSRMEKI